MPTLNQRSLTSLTPQECQTLFAIAFGYSPAEESLHVAPMHESMGIGDDTYTMILQPDGHAYAWYSKTDIKFHITVSRLLGLINTLDSINVTFDPHSQQLPDFDHFQPLAQTESNPPGLG